MILDLDEERRARHPLMDEAGLTTLRHILEHPCAPRWNSRAGDRLTHPWLEQVWHWAETLNHTPRRRTPKTPPWIAAWLTDRQPQLPWLRGLDPATLKRLRRDTTRHHSWTTLPTLSREDVAARITTLVPDDAKLPEMIVYRTAGTTGHPLLVPHHPWAVACYQPMLTYALARHGAHPTLTPGRLAGFLVGAQRQTVTCASVLRAWNGAGWAKINLHPDDWHHPDHRARFLTDLEPQVITGDPISLSELARIAPQLRPRALVSTAVAMSRELARRLAEQFRCPLVEWYSLTETGPIGYSCPKGEGYHLLPHDLHVETLGPAGESLPPGQRGEITVSGGRNPFLPLVRYRTGDWGILDFAPCPCGDPAPRILELEGRQPVAFRDHHGAPVNTVDISRILREFPIVQHQFRQHEDGSCHLRLRPPAMGQVDLTALRHALTTLLGPLPLAIEEDPHLGERTGKSVAYESSLIWE